MQYITIVFVCQQHYAQKSMIIQKDILYPMTVIFCLIPWICFYIKRKNKEQKEEMARIQAKLDAADETLEKLYEAVSAELADDGSVHDDIKR